MADGVAITAGSGTTIATDQLAGTEHVQFMKLMSGTLDDSAKIPGDATSGLLVNASELPATAALADSTANPSLSAIGAFGMVYDGSTWHRSRGDGSGPWVQIRDKFVLAQNLTALNQAAGVFTNGGQATCVIRVSGTWTATLSFEATIDGSNWFPVIGYPIGGGSQGASTTTNGVFVIAAGGLQQIRAKATAFTSGTIVVDLNAGFGEQVMLSSRLPPYSGIVSEFAPAITAGVKECAVLWHPSTVAADVYIVEIGATCVVTTAATGTGRSAYELQLISADGTAGTTGSQNLDFGATASGCTYRANPTAGGTVSGNAFYRKHQFAGVVPLTGGNSIYHTIFTASTLGDAIVLRGGVAAGLRFSINNIAAFTGLVYQIAPIIRWIEL